MSKLYRQGDFLFKLVDSLPTEAKREKAVKGRFVVGFGEVTGHHHSFPATTKEAEIKTLDNVRWIVAKAPVSVTHQEHDTIQLPQGIYQIIPQRSYERGEIQRVID